MVFHHDSLERKAALRGACPLLVTKHRSGLSFELREYPLPTSELTPELQQCIATALDKILLMCEGFPVGSNEVYILQNFACILPQLLYIRHTLRAGPQSRRPL